MQNVQKSCFLGSITIFVSPERSSERDYVITDSVRSMYVYAVLDFG